MCVGDRNGQRVGGIRAGDLYPRQQSLDHRMDLRLFGAPGPDHRFLDQAGGIFADIETSPRGDHQCDASCLAQLQGRLRRVPSLTTLELLVREVVPALNN